MDYRIIAIVFLFSAPAQSIPLRLINSSQPNYWGIAPLKQLSSGWGEETITAERRQVSELNQATIPVELHYPGQAGEPLAGLSSQSTAASPKKELSQKDGNLSLGSDEFRHAIAAARQRKATANKVIAQTVQDYLLKVQISTARLRFDEAAKTYEAAIAAVPDSFAIQIAFARFNDRLNRTPQALEAYKRALELARRGESQASVAATLMDLGSFYLRQDLRAEAREVLDESLIIYADLSAKKPEKFSSQAAQVRNILADLSKE